MKFVEYCDYVWGNAEIVKTGVGTHRRSLSVVLKLMLPTYKLFIFFVSLKSPLRPCGAVAYPAVSTLLETGYLEFDGVNRAGSKR